jgi:hypothetical protein
VKVDAERLRSRCSRGKEPTRNVDQQAAKSRGSCRGVGDTEASIQLEKSFFVCDSSSFGCFSLFGFSRKLEGAVR